MRDFLIIVQASYPLWDAASTSYRCAKEPQTASSKAELEQIKSRLDNISQTNQEKDRKISLIENKIFTQEKMFKEELNSANTRIGILTNANETLDKKLDEANTLIEALTEQLEEAQENKRGRSPSPSPSFFK